MSAAYSTRAEAQGADPADSRARLPHRRHDRRQARHPRGLAHGTRLDPGPRQDRDRGDEEGRSPADRRHRDSLSAEQDAIARAHRRTGPRQGARRHFRSARRIGSRRHAHRDRAEARRSRRGGAEQPVQADPAAAVVRHHHAGDRRRPAEGAQPARSDRALHRLPARGGPPPHRVRAQEGRSARAHSRRPEDRARPPRRGDQVDPRLEEPARSQDRVGHAVRPHRDPGAGDPRHAAAAPDRPGARQDPRRAGDAARADRQAARTSSPTSRCC